ncbi:MAG: helix-turn-helix transcriptional regulator [Armatimonadetes bacterium]|nr:helix-turn-helix transcriptional regulator [Armatimonadota bacterium]
MTQSLRQVVARNMKRLRLRRGWSQEDLADECGLHRTYIGAIERLERNITLETLEKLAVGLGVEPPDLLSQARTRRRVR